MNCGREDLREGLQGKEVSEGGEGVTNEVGGRMGNKRKVEGRIN